MIPRLAIAWATFVAMIFAGAAAGAVEISSAGAPTIDVTADGARICLLLPAPRTGECEGLAPNIADKVADAESVRAFALVRFADGRVIPVTLTEIDRGTYAADGEGAKRLVKDYVKGFKGDVVGVPKITLKGAESDPLGAHLFLGHTTEDDAGNKHFRTFFFFGQRKVYAFIFSDTDAAAVDAFADRTMRTVAPGTFTPGRTRPLEVIGAVFAVAFVVVVVLVGVVAVATRRKRVAPGPGHAMHGAPYYGQPSHAQPPYGQQPPHGQPPHGQPPYGQPPYGWPPHGRG